MPDPATAPLERPSVQASGKNGDTVGVVNVISVELQYGDTAPLSLKPYV